MAYKKKNLTPEERSAIARANASKRKTFGAHRGPRTPKPGELPKPVDQRRTLQAKQSAYAVYVRYAHVHGLTLLDAMSRIADGLAEQDGRLRAPVVIRTV